MLVDPVLFYLSETVEGCFPILVHWIYINVCQCVYGRERDLQMAEFQSQIMQSLISFYSNAAFTELIFRSLNLFFFLQKVWGLYLYFRWLCFYTIFHLSFFLGFYHCSAFRTPHLLFSIHVMLILETQRGEVLGKLGTTNRINSAEYNSQFTSLNPFSLFVQ